ncbi:MAG TPA: ArsA-related P-loop ATPase [Microthrixaceae bacterium]|nr:ArsA-related P-loop ATPase [Microthrixaceae bacterium]
MTLEEVVAASHVVVCCGSGGVGKTTSAAVLAMHAASEGRRAVVVTIDPARRLADALGLEGLSNEPALVEGPWPGEMWAMMLDTKSTFDGLVRRYSRDPAQAEEILENAFYRNISSSLSGTQEYMASEKLYELAVEGDYDLVVVDTPPTRNALDFLEAPQRLARFLDHRLYRVLMMPTRGLVKAVNLAAQTVMRSVAKVVGADVIADAISFFSAFEGMEQGFKERAREVDALLRQDKTAFVLIASPKADTVAEAGYFASELKRLGIEVKALIVNRMSPVFGGSEDRVSDVDGEASADPMVGFDAPEGSALADLVNCLKQSRENSLGEHKHLLGIVEDVSPAPVVGVEIQPFEVSDLDTLTKLGSVVFDPASTLPNVG